MNFAREGLVFIAIAAVVATGAFGLAFIRKSWPLWLLAFVFAVLALWVAYFFRDPERTGERGSNLIVAPADGRVVMISDVDEPDFLKSRAKRISIFMNVFNVHVNRYPIDGVVKYVHYNPGRFLNAASDKSSLENEQMSVGIDSYGRKILVRQIAGLIARRIVTYSKLDQDVKQGERMGMIRFGSRVDVFIPTSSAVTVQVGQTTSAGVTVLARLSQ